MTFSLSVSKMSWQDIPAQLIRLKNVLAGHFLPRVLKRISQFDTGQEIVLGFR